MLKFITTGIAKFGYCVCVSIRLMMQNDKKFKSSCKKYCARKTDTTFEKRIPKSNYLEIVLPLLQPRSIISFGQTIKNP